MTKKSFVTVFRVVPLLILLCLLLAGCNCKHEWRDATTETPKTCSICQKTEGERIITDARFTTAANKELFGTWKGIYKMPSTFIDADLTQTLDLEVSFIFNNDGSFQNIVKIANKDDFVQITDYDLSLFEHEDTGVYYVADGKIFIGAKWDDTLRPETYTITDNILTIDIISQAYPGITLTKS